MTGGREAGHVGADLSEDHLGAALRHAGDRHQERHRRFVRAQRLLDPGAEDLHRGIGLVHGRLSGGVAGQHHGSAAEEVELGVDSPTVKVEGKTFEGVLKLASAEERRSRPGQV